MNRMLAAFRAKLLILHAFRMHPLILRVGIVLRLTFGASKYYYISWHIATR